MCCYYALSDSVDVLHATLIASPTFMPTALQLSCRSQTNTSFDFDNRVPSPPPTILHAQRVAFAMPYYSSNSILPLLFLPCH